MIFLFQHLSKLKFFVLIVIRMRVIVEIAQFSPDFLYTFNLKTTYFDFFVVVVLHDCAFVVVKLVATNACIRLDVPHSLTCEVSTDSCLNFDQKCEFLHV